MILEFCSQSAGLRKISRPFQPYRSHTKVWMPCRIIPQQICGILQERFVWNIFVCPEILITKRAGKCPTIPTLEAVRQWMHNTIFWCFRVQGMVNKPPKFMHSIWTSLFSAFPFSNFRATRARKISVTLVRSHHQLSQKVPITHLSISSATHFPSRGSLRSVLSRVQYSLKMPRMRFGPRDCGLVICGIHVHVHPVRGMVVEIWCSTTLFNTRFKTQI